MEKFLITGGAGFVGAQIAVRLRQKLPKAKIVAFDNLRRRGSELNLPLLKKHQIHFSHGDLRCFEDLADIAHENFDTIIDACAEPSVLAGVNSTPDYVVSTNLLGTIQTLKFLHKHSAALLFLSTSRVYSIDDLLAIPLCEEGSRFIVDKNKKTNPGIDETFPTNRRRSIYGATKLASEMLIEEFSAQFKIKTMINRCGVIAGPGQFGKTDQGVFTLWAANHVFNKPLRYTGFGGTGKQVRDLLHPDDLFDLIWRQLENMNLWNAQPYNVGGGLECSTSLREWTEYCASAAGRKIEITPEPASHGVDIPYYVTDNSQVAHAFGWKPKFLPDMIAKDIVAWIQKNESTLSTIFI